MAALNHSNIAAVLDRQHPTHLCVHFDQGEISTVGGDDNSSSAGGRHCNENVVDQLLSPDDVYALDAKSRQHNSGLKEGGMVWSGVGVIDAFALGFPRFVDRIECDWFGLSAVVFLAVLAEAIAAGAADAFFLGDFRAGVAVAVVVVDAFSGRFLDFVDRMKCSSGEFLAMLAKPVIASPAHTLVGWYLLARRTPDTAMINAFSGGLVCFMYRIEFSCSRQFGFSCAG